MEAPRGAPDAPGSAGRAPGAPQEAQSEPQEAKNELQEGQNEPQEGSGGPKRLRVAILDPPDVVFGRFPLDFHRFHARPAQERGDRDALPPQTPGVGREAAEQGRRRSYGLAVSILGRLSPLSPCFCSLSCRSCSCCSCRSLCSRLTCIACTLSGLSRFPFHDSQVEIPLNGLAPYDRNCVTGSADLLREALDEARVARSVWCVEGSARLSTPDRSDL